MIYKNFHGYFAYSLKKGALFCLFLIAFSTAAIGQNEHHSDQLVSLSSDHTLKLIDQDSPSFVQQIQFESEQKVDAILSVLKQTYNSPLSTILYCEKTGITTLNLEIREKPEWTTEDWNAYLLQLKKSN